VIPAWAGRCEGLDLLVCQYGWHLWSATTVHFDVSYLLERAPLILFDLQVC
jgi:hypothetical protein